MKYSVRIFFALACIIQVFFIYIQISFYFQNQLIKAIDLKVAGFNWGSECLGKIVTEDYNESEDLEGSLTACYLNGQIASLYVTQGDGSHCEFYEFYYFEKNVLTYVEVGDGCWSPTGNDDSLSTVDVLTKSRYYFKYEKIFKRFRETSVEYNRHLEENTHIKIDCGLPHEDPDREELHEDCNELEDEGFLRIQMEKFKNILNSR